MLTNEHLIQAYKSAGADNGVTYLSTPITSGPRFFSLCQELSISPVEFILREPERWRTEVLRANISAAHEIANRLRSQVSPRIVIDPSWMFVEGWDQFDYNSFWLKLIGTFDTVMALAPGWEYSVGARGEVAKALTLGLSVVDADGEELSLPKLENAADKAQKHLLATFANVEDPIVTLPDIHVEQQLTPSAASQAFEWLVGERSYQVQKFGTASDDEHTLQGLGENDWWWRQLTSYFHRARVLGLDTPVGRQALAKFVATGCGLLESVIRTSGPLPLPGVSSGELNWPEGNAVD